jgi:hypothetical protein
MVSNQTQPALLFMPDISGFTQFVNETEIIHSQHIIKELLEILIEANQLDLQVGEVEGDAIFFYKLGVKPDLKSLLEQVEKMFTRFHQHLKLYDHRRICPCGACKTAVQLTLKVVAHFGEVTPFAVKEHKKLFGKDVILVHRLLKNNLDKHEYFLFTDSLAQHSDHANEFPGWYNPEQGSEQYDLGSVPFSFSDLSALHEKIPELVFPGGNFSSKSHTSFSEERVIELPMEELFSIMIEQLQRGSWMTKKKDDGNSTDEEIYSLGSKHVCLLTSNSTNVTESVKIEPDKIELIEVSERGIAGYRYRLKKISPGQTLLSIEMLVKNNPILKLGFSIVFKSRMKKRVHQFFTNLEIFLKTNNSSSKLAL